MPAGHRIAPGGAQTPIGWRCFGLFGPHSHLLAVHDRIGELSRNASHRSCRCRCKKALRAGTLAISVARRVAVASDVRFVRQYLA